MIHLQREVSDDFEPDSMDESDLQSSKRHVHRLKQGVKVIKPRCQTQRLDRRASWAEQEVLQSLRPLEVVERIGAYARASGSRLWQMASAAADNLVPRRKS